MVTEVSIMLECLFRSVQCGRRRGLTTNRKSAGEKDYLKVEEHEGVVQKVCGFRGCPLRTLILLECLTELTRLFPHLFAQQLWVAQQLCCPRSFPICHTHSQQSALAASGGSCQETSVPRRLCLPDTHLLLEALCDRMPVYLKSLSCAAGLSAAVPAV